MSKRSKRSGHTKRGSFRSRLKRFLEWRKQQKAQRQAKSKRAAAKKRSAKSRKTSAIKKWLTSPALWFRGLFSVPGLTWRALRKSWKRRSPILLLQSIPAIASIIVGAYFFSASTLTTRGDLVDSYTQAARSAMSEEQFEQAKVYLDRLVKLGVEDNRTLYLMARALDEVGDQDRVVAILDKIAPNDRAVYADAHFWNAQRISATFTADRPRIAETELHLQYVVKLDPGHLDANYRLGQLYLILGRPENAVEHLETVVSARPSVSLELARAYLLVGDQNRAIQMAKTAQAYASRESELDRMDADKTLSWANAELFLENYVEAIRILRSAVTLHQDNPEALPNLQRALSLTYMEYADWLNQKVPNSEAAQLQLLESALETYPFEQQLLERFLRLLQDDRWLELEPRLLELLSRGESPAFIHLIIGTAAGQRDDFKKALFHLNRANELKPDLIIVLNNLAYFIASSPDGDLDTAMRFCKMALEQTPDSHAIRETRGQILVRQGRFVEALSDLEYALQVYKDNVQLHRALAETYENLDQPELARIHRERITELNGVTE